MALWQPLRWGSIVGLPRATYGPLPELMVAMTVVTGVVDAFSYLGLGHVFVANMTGNVVFLAFAVAGAAGFSIPASVVALSAFAAGALLAGRLAGRLARHRADLLAVACTVQLLLVASATVVSWLDPPGVGGPGRFLLLVLLALAMGIQNATARRLAVPDLTTTVLTLTITALAAEPGADAGAGSKSGRRVLSVAAMFTGGLAGALLVVHGWRSLALVLTLVVLFGVGAVAAHQAATDPPWDTAGP